MKILAAEYSLYCSSGAMDNEMTNETQAHRALRKVRIRRHHPGRASN
jgi:hypothetical protein